MKITNLLLLVLFVFVVVGNGQLMPDVPFKDVKTVFVDGESFEIVESKCDDQIGVQPCPQHVKAGSNFLPSLSDGLVRAG